MPPGAALTLGNYSAHVARDHTGGDYPDVHAAQAAAPSARRRQWINRQRHIIDAGDPPLSREFAKGQLPISTRSTEERQQQATIGGFD